jgi:hypothetical protein
VSTSQQDADVVGRYLRTFATRDLAELRTVVADDVEMYGACKMYQVGDGKIVRFWGEADLFGLLRGLDMLPSTVLEFT